MLILLLLLTFAFLAFSMRAGDFDFQTTVDDIKTVPSQYAGLYVKGEDGKYNLEDGLKARLDTSGLNSALSKERLRAKELDKLVAGFKALGDTPEEIAEKLKALEVDDDEDDPKKKKTGNEREKLKAELKAAEDRIRAEADQKLTAMERSLQKHMVEREAISALAEAKGSSELLLPHVISKCKLVKDEAGDYTIRVVDKDGDPEGDGKGGFKTVKQLVAEMRSDAKYSRAFDSDGAGGTGARRVGSGAGGGNHLPQDSVSKIERGLSNRR